MIESVAMVTTYLLRGTGPVTLANVMIEVLTNELSNVFNRTLWLPTENKLKSHPSVNANCTVDSWFRCKITRCNFLWNLVHTNISTSKVCHDVLSYFSASRSVESMLMFSFSILGFKVNYKLQKQTFSTQNKPKAISIIEHPKHEIIIQITWNCLLERRIPEYLIWSDQQHQLVKSLATH